MSGNLTDAVKSKDKQADGTLGLLTLNNPVFCCYLFWASILVIKMLLMSLLTGIQRVRNKTFANPEDSAMQKTTELKFNDPNVERARRAHRNDLENVLPYLIMALLYVATGPGALLARILIRLGAIARVLHTLVYAFRPVPQPARSICFFCTFLITIYMAVYAIIHTAVYI